MNAEKLRLEENSSQEALWHRWGPYLSERQWGTVREDYSECGDAWDYFPHDHARSRAYRWGEDGLLGISDRHGMFCFGIALWNGKDPILKERLFGLTNSQGNHGEDVKECYFYLDSTPTHSYMKAMYHYPQAEFPYEQLITENARRGKCDPEFEIADTGVFDEGRYFSVVVEYAKVDVNDSVIRITATNQGPEKSRLVIMPQVWFRNRWSWSGGERPQIQKSQLDNFVINHPRYGVYQIGIEGFPTTIFTENDTNVEKLYGVPNPNPYVKDAFHRYVVNGELDAVNPAQTGSKAAAIYDFELDPGESKTIHLSFAQDSEPLDPKEYQALFVQRIKEADEFYEELTPGLSQELKTIQRQAFAGLLWSKQYYHYDVNLWLNGDPLQPPPPESRKQGRNKGWTHFLASEVLSMPDKWEYPWFASWDLAFHTISLALVDPDFAKYQLILLLREWYLHPNGQIPAYEWSFSDVNPPVHAWAAWRVYRIEARATGKGDINFLERVFHKLLLNFTWWVDRKDPDDRNVFEGGFLGLDNIGVFDRNQPLPDGSQVEQSDGTSWMASYCLTMLSIALELATFNSAYEDVASKFIEHFLFISHSVNVAGQDGLKLWDDEDGFYYDALYREGEPNQYVKVRSMVGLMPLFATAVLEADTLEKFPHFSRRIEWLLEHRPELSEFIMPMTVPGQGQRLLLSLVSKDKLDRILTKLFDEKEFLSPFGIRSLSKVYEDNPYTLNIAGHSYTIDYEPAESTTGSFGGNSNWRGPIWFPPNYLLIEALQRLDFYYGESLSAEYPAGSGKTATMAEVAADLEKRLLSIFLRTKGGKGLPPALAGNNIFSHESSKGLNLYFEYFNGDTGKGLGASHQTGWTGLIAKIIQQLYVTAYSDHV
ncbi:MAG TPA: hypothetical protein VGL56_08635 [Fimbriimonadaceae bacterium]|jgi:hypothetical protein